MTANTLTLERYLEELKDTVAATDQAYYVHNKSATGNKILVPDTAEVLLESGNVIYVCQHDKYVFPSGASAARHHDRLHKVREASKDKEPKAVARRKTQTNARTDLSEPTYGELKDKLDKAHTRIGELDRELKLSDKENKGLELAVVALKGKVEDLEKGIVDHSNCYEYVGKAAPEFGLEIDIVRKDGYVYKAVPL